VKFTTTQEKYYVLRLPTWCTSTCCHIRFRADAYFFLRSDYLGTEWAFSVLYLSLSSLSKWYRCLTTKSCASNVARYLCALPYKPSVMTHGLVPSTLCDIWFLPLDHNSHWLTAKILMCCDCLPGAHRRVAHIIFPIVFFAWVSCMTRFFLRTDSLRREHSLRYLFLCQVWANHFLSKECCESRPLRPARVMLPEDSTSLQTTSKGHADSDIVPSTLCDI